MSISFNKKFIKQQAKLTQAQQKQLDSRLVIFSQNQFNPILRNHALHHPYNGCYSINITGDIRAIYEIVDDTFIFVAIGSHSELYE